jgi:hypothetical protein
MHKFIRSLSTREVVSQQLPAIALSMVIAELFYKFHSFTLECLAFLATWYVVDLLIDLVFSRFLGYQASSVAPKRR